MIIYQLINLQDTRRDVHKDLNMPIQAQNDDYGPILVVESIKFGLITVSLSNKPRKIETTKN